MTGNTVVTETAVDQSALLAECADVYRISKRFEARSDKSVHWNVFPADFAHCFERPEAWPSLLRNGITVGFNDDTMDAKDRWEWRQKHDYAALAPRHCTKAYYLSEVKQKFKYNTERFGLAFVQKVLNTEVGSPRLAECTFTVKYPQGVREQSFWASAHDLSLAYFCGRIFEVLRSSDAAMQCHRADPALVEIGGGFGELSAKMKIVDPKIRSVIFDLPEPGAVQLYFLRQRFPNSKIYTIRDFKRIGPEIFQTRFDFLLLPPAFIKLLPQGWPSVMANIRSFQEMNWISIVDYFTEIQRSLRRSGLFCCINRHYKRIGEQDIEYERFPFDDRWRVLADARVPFQSHIKEGFFERV